MKVLLVFSVALFSCANAWFFNRDRTVDAVRAVDPACRASGENGECAFYTCFERRFPCRSQGYMVRFGSHYCERFNDVQNYRHKFTPEGQTFLTASQQCMTNRLANRSYERESINCHRLEHDAFEIMGECYTNNGFCDIFWENKEAFSDVFESRDLFDRASLKIWREIFKFAFKCTGQSASTTFNFIRDKITSLVIPAK